MIAVAGEALIDLVVDRSGAVTAVPGGGPFNAARTVSRLGGQAMFLGRLSRDAFGMRLRETLAADGVRLGVAEAVSFPTTLAVATIGEDGAASYCFYLDGTSASELVPDDVPRSTLDEVSALLLGGLGLVMEPIATTLEEVVATLAGDVVVMLDPNCRPSAIRDLVAYRRRVADLIERVDVLKVSTEDITILEPGVAPEIAAADMLARGPAAVLLTDGAGPVRVYTAADRLTVAVPAGDIVDTVGAGDAFSAAFLTWWHSGRRTRADLADAAAVSAAVDAAVTVAVLTCGVRGAVPPRPPRWQEPSR